MPVRKAHAAWTGGLKEGSGRMAFGSGAYEGPYSFSSRFEEGTGTNPEELIGAAHAGCFSMALAGALGRAGFEPRRVATDARVTIEKQEAGFRITRILLRTEVDVPGMEEAAFQEVAEKAKSGCPVSQALAGVDIQLEAKRVG